VVVEAEPLEAEEVEHQAEQVAVVKAQSDVLELHQEQLTLVAVEVVMLIMQVHQEQADQE
tara:strand:- start:24 stop:203 length:180 start_codon:yes stop_codon:yes gene_type:complete